MASLAVLTLKEPIIPLVTTFDPESIRNVKLTHYWTSAGGENRSSKMYLPKAADSSNHELLIYVIDQFIDACHNDRLHLSTGVQRYTKFREVIGGDLRVEWQRISDAQANKTTDWFRSDLTNLLEVYLSTTAFEDQREYLRASTKPYEMSCEALASRLRIVSTLSKYLPGSGNQELLPTDDAKKRAYFMLMPMSWRVKFAESGHVLDGNTYSLTSLTRFMGVQQALSKRKDNGGGKRKAAPTGGSGRGHGGRGRYGGRGRGSSGNYQYSSYNRGYGYSGSGYAAAGYNTPRSYQSQGSTTPSSSRGGRGYAGSGRSYQGNRPSPYSSGRGSYTPPSSGRGRIDLRPTYGGSPGRGPTPYVPSFYAETQDHFYGHEEPLPEHHDHYYYGEQPSEPHDHYYEEHTAPQEDHYQVDSNANQGAQEHESESQNNASEDAHWLGEFGF